MTKCEIQLSWLGQAAVSEFGTVVDEQGRSGLGAVLIIERSGTREVLLVRKSARPGFEGNDQFALAGGMIHPRGAQPNFSKWICQSLQERVTAEVNLYFSHYPSMTMLAGAPPIVAAYTARGRRRHTVIVSFCLAIRSDFQLCAQDSTVYDPGWRDLRDGIVNLRITKCEMIQYKVFGKIMTAI